MSLIGTTTTYVGDEIPGLRGTRVRIFGVMRGALRPGVDVDADDYFVSDDATLARLGGVTKDDRTRASCGRWLDTSSYYLTNGHPERDRQPGDDHEECSRHRYRPQDAQDRHRRLEA